MKKFIYILLLTILLIPNIVSAENLDENKNDNQEEIIDNVSETNDSIENSVEELKDKKLCNDENGNTYSCLVPKVDKDIRVYDYADLLTDEEEKNIHSIVDNYIEKSSMDLVIVTLDKNPYGVSDYYTQIYAQDFYYYNDFGVGDKKDGLIVLIDMDNRYPYIATKGNAILVYDDERIDSIHDSAYNYLVSGNYYSAIKSYIDKIEYYFEGGVPESNKYFCIDDNGDYYKCKSAPKEVNWGISLVIAIVGSLLGSFIHTRKYKEIKLAVNANNYLTNSNITERTDNFLTTFTSRIRRSHDSGGSSGHSGGGSSISHGSGGSFGGGGGRHF